MFNRSKALALSLLAATFVLGVAAGATAVTIWGDRLGHRPPPPRERMGYAERLQQDLQLAPAQRESVEVILARREQAMEQLWSDTRPKFDTLRAQIRTEIMRILTVEQRAKYEELLARAERRRAEGERGPYGR